MERAVPHIERYIKKGQLEIISDRQWRKKAGEVNRVLETWTDKAVISGFDSFRAAIISPPGKSSKKTVPTYRETDEISRQNMVALYAYPRDNFDAAELMEVVKRHRFALIRSAGKWEILESSEANLSRVALTKGELLFRSLFENMLEGYAYCRMVFKSGHPQDFIFVTVNRAFERQTGLKDVTGKKASQSMLNLKETDIELLEACGRVALTGKPERHEMYLEQLKGWFSLSIYSPGKGTIAILIDNITERKKAEKELKQYSADLEASNKDLESFSYSVSHDLRAPLRSLDGFSLAVMEDYADKLDEQGRKWLQNIREASQKMGRLIDDLLGLSKVVRAELQIESIDLSSLINSLVKELRANYPERKMEVKVTPGLKARGDASLLRIALVNLLDNAFKFTSKCEIARIEFGTMEIDGQCYYFVKDNGTGVDMTYADKLFKAFHRLHKEEDYPGTGIGLATVSRIIQRHGGKILTRGEPGQGAIFLFSLNQDKIRGYSRKRTNRLPAANPAPYEE